MAAGRYDFSVQSNSFEPVNFVRTGVPVVAIAAAFQKDPQVLIAHPGAGNDTLEAMKGKPVLISAASRENFWKFLVQRFGFSDDQIRPYTFSLAPFLASKTAIQQGYLGSEPFLVRQQGGFDPIVLSLSDAGFAGYASLIATSRALTQQNPDLVRRFLTATEAGWQSYLNGDPTPGDALIRQANPDMSPELLAYGRAALKSHGIVQSGDANTFGIGAMTDARWTQFFQSMVAAHLYPPSLNYKAAYTLQFTQAGK